MRLFSKERKFTRKTEDKFWWFEDIDPRGSTFSSEFVDSDLAPELPAFDPLPQTNQVLQV
jgi:hypothetical protein